MSGPPVGVKVEPYVYDVPSTRLLYKPLADVQGGGCWADVFVPKGEQPADGWPVGRAPPLALILRLDSYRSS
jgi:hypothetical protein